MPPTTTTTITTPTTINTIFISHHHLTLTIFTLVIIFSTSSLVNSVPVKSCYNISSTRQYCLETDSDRNIALQNWDNAFRFCSNKNRNLLRSGIILDTDLDPATSGTDIQLNIGELEEVLLNRFISDNSISEDVIWMAGKRILNSGYWAWMDGTRYNGKGQMMSSDGSALLPSMGYQVRINGDKTGDYNLTAYDPSGALQAPFICSDCSNGPCDYYKYESFVTWFTARNYCLNKNMDLAKFNDNDVLKMKLTGSTQYWIGLTNYNLNWIAHDNTTDPVKVTWFSGNPGLTNATSCLNRNMQGVWFIRNCDDKLTCICAYVQEIGVNNSSVDRNFCLSRLHTGLSIAGALLIYAITLAISIALCVRFRRKSSSEADNHITKHNNNNNNSNINSLPQLEDLDGVYTNNATINYNNHNHHRNYIHNNHNDDFDDYDDFNSDPNNQPPYLANRQTTPKLSQSNLDQGNIKPTRKPTRMPSKKPVKPNDYTNVGDGRVKSSGEYSSHGDYQRDLNDYNPYCNGNEG